MNKLTKNEKIHGKELIYKAEFEKAKKLIKHINLKDLEGFVLEIGFDDYSFTVYGFILSMLLDEETAELHTIAAELLASSLCHYNDAYSFGLFHARRAVEMDDESVEYKELLLLFHDIPEHLIDAEEGVKIAREVLSKKPTSLAAISVLKRYKMY